MYLGWSFTFAGYLPIHRRQVPHESTEKSPDYSVFPEHMDTATLHLSSPPTTTSNALPLFLQGQLKPASFQKTLLGQMPYFTLSLPRLSWPKRIHRLRHVFQSLFNTQCCLFTLPGMSVSRTVANSRVTPGSCTCLIHSRRSFKTTRPGTLL